MKIVFLDRSTVGHVRNLDKLKELGEVAYHDITPEEKTVERTREAEIIITNKVVINKPVMDQAKDLKLICVAATGMNNIDLEYAEKKGIEVKNVSDYSTFSVTQSTFAMLLYLLNHLRYCDDYVSNGGYSGSPIFTHHGREFFELRNKIFGIVGLGTIGKSVAEIAGAFQCRIIYYSTSGKNNNPEYHRVDFIELLERSDIISIHAPLNENTRNLIGYSEFSRMKKNCYLLNTGRGSIVVEKDLARALDEGLIAGAGIDVLEHEPIENGNPLLKINNREKLLITPHTAWASIESREELVDMVYENIREYIHNH